LPRKKKADKKAEESVPVIDPVKEYYGELLAELAGKMYGETAKKVMAHIIKSGGSAPEETIGKEASVKSNEARKILQKLGNEALVSCHGKKTGEKVYHYWTINWDRVRDFLINRLKKTREKLQILVEFLEQNVIYKCTICGREFALEEALDHDFTCPYDGGILVEVDKRDAIEFLKGKISEIDKALENIGA